MNGIIKMLLLTGGKFMPKILVDHLLKTKNEYKNLKKQEIQYIFIKTN